MVVDDFKYSFFFWLDIIATLSLIPDIRWLLDGLLLLVGATPSYDSVDAHPGKLTTQSITQSKVQKVIKSLRLIRLVRIIKLYKYVVQSKKRGEGADAEAKRKKKKMESEEDMNEQSLFQQETDPSKLGKALSDTITRRVIIGVLLMLMVLPLLTFSEIDYSSVYGLRELFWFGRSSCDDKSSYFCNPGVTWINEDGWNRLLRDYTESAQSSESNEP